METEAQQHTFVQVHRIALISLTGNVNNTQVCE